MSGSHVLTQAAPMRAFWLGVAAYAVPTFILGYVWHLVAFAPVYKGLAIYRDDLIIPFGMLAIAIQGMAFSWIYPRLFDTRGPVLRNGLLYGLGTGLVSWSYMTIAVAAKNVMTSVPTYLLIETGFTLVQFAIAGPLLALAHRERA